MSDKERGLYNKYNVSRTDGKPITGCAIVLEVGDPIARPAILRWAEEMRRAGYKQVWFDTVTELAETYPKPIMVGDIYWFNQDQSWQVASIKDDVVSLKLLSHYKTKYDSKDLSLLDLKRLLVEQPQP